MDQRYYSFYDTRKDGVWKDDKSVKNPLKNKGKFDIGQNGKRDVLYGDAWRREEVQKGRKPVIFVKNAISQRINNFEIDCCGNTRKRRKNE